MRQDLSKYYRTKFRDTDLSLSLNPLTQDFSNLSHIDSVKKRVQNLVRTGLYDRPYQPALGSQIEGMLFEFGEFTTLRMIEDMVKDLILEFEPAIDELTVQISQMLPGPGIKAHITFKVVEIQEEASLEIIFNRVR